MPADGRRLSRLAFLAAIGVAGLAFARSWSMWPRDQTVHYILGEAAPRVEELDASWTASGDDDFAREARFRYAKGTAPRIVTHEPRLRDGTYTVKIEIIADARRSVVERNVVLGGATSIDLTSDVPVLSRSSTRGETGLP
jgi:hypothetical protein